MPDKALGWLQFAGGAAALFLQIWSAIHGVSIDPGHAAVGVGLAGGGIATALQASKIQK